jgi:AcrR family transcriptional regulator
MEPTGFDCYTNGMSRQMNKERTRRRLLQAILKTIHRHGHAALTTGRVAQLAGVAQPTFYVHFRGMDQALAQVAEWVAEELGPSFAARGSVVDADGPADLLQEAVLRCTRALVQDRKVAEVFLRNRRDETSALGIRWALLTGSLRHHMKEIVTQVRPGISPDEASLHAELLAGVVFTLAEAHLDGRVPDIDRGTAVACRAMASGIASSSSVADAA